MKQISIPDNVKIVFVFSTGQKEILSSKFYKELSEVYFWMEQRIDEFQLDANTLALLTKKEKISVLEIYYTGQKEIIENLNLGEYSLRGGGGETPPITSIHNPPFLSGFHIINSCCDFVSGFFQFNRFSTNGFLKTLSRQSACDLPGYFFASPLFHAV